MHSIFSSCQSSSSALAGAMRPGWPYHFSYQKIISPADGVLVICVCSSVECSWHTLDCGRHIDGFLPLFSVSFVWGLCESCHAPLPNQSAIELQHEIQMFQLKKHSTSLFLPPSLPPHLHSFSHVPACPITELIFNFKHPFVKSITWPDNTIILIH